MCAVFNERTVAALRADQLNDTADFLELLVKLWNILNIKRKDAGKTMNDPNRAPLCQADDPRINLIESMTAAFADMPRGKGFGRRTSLTSETRNAVVQTLQGMLYLVKYLLDGSHAYVLPGIFQSDRLEGELGIYRCVTAVLSSYDSSMKSKCM